MARKRPARKGNPDLRQQQHVAAPQIEQIAILLNAISFLDYSKQRVSPTLEIEAYTQQIWALSS